jgi:hypothetical protein
MKILRTSRHHGCLICGTEKSKCGWKADDPNFLFCMSIHDAINGPPGWKFIGDTDNGQWGMFVPDTEREYSEEERAAYKQRQQQLKLNQRSSHAKSLSEAERHHQHTKLIDQLSLHPHHRLDLIRRGLSEELIRVGKFRSIDKFQKLDFEVSHNLAGVNISGWSLTNNSAGYIVPIWNEHSQIIGYQIRNDANSDDVPKYLWANSKPNLRRRKGASSHLQNGELPLTFCVPAGFTLETNPISKKLSSCINLSEGMLKAYILAQLRELLVIGAAGGNFTASPETLKRYLEAASTMLDGTKQVVLWADAAAIANRQIMLQYRRTYQLLKSWGYTLQIAWWGQIDKNCKDGDEYLGEYELLTWAQFEGMSRHPNRFWDSVKQELGKIKKCLRRTPPTPTFSPELPKKQNKLEYVPGFLPSYGEYVEMGCPKITYKNDERVSIWKEAVSKGWSYTLDGSVPGVGKSHTAGTLTAALMGMWQLMYLAADHRNPTTSTIENNFVDVPPRFYQMVLDKTRLTPNNKPFRVHPTGNINKDDIVKGNCARADVFAEARRKNLDLESSQNVICQGCLLRKLCTGGVGASGDYYGYLSERVEALKHPQVRLHPDSTPLPENYNYSQVGGIWDEVSKLMRSTKKIEVRMSDFLQTAGQHSVTHSGFGNYPSNSPLTVVYNVLQELFNLKQSDLPRYGLSDNDILSKLGFAPDTVAEVIGEIVENLSPDLDFLTESSDTIDTSELSHSDKKVTGKLNKLLRNEHNQETQKKLKSLPLNWLVPMLEIWGGYVPGCFTYKNGVFTIHQFDSRHRDLARAFAFNIFLDGTISVDTLSLILGVPKEHILHIETETPDYSNLEIKHILDMGNLGRDRRDSQQVRVDILREKIVEFEVAKGNLADSVKVIERKAFAREGDGYHFRDSRGINRFSNAKALISIGVPCANIGDMSAEYSLLMKDKRMRSKLSANSALFMLNLVYHLPTVDVVSLIPECGYTVQDFIDSSTIAEILQEIGRLRSHLRPDESLTFYFVGDYDLSPVLAELPGVKYTLTEAIEVSPMCAAGEERTTLMVMNAVGNLISRGVIAPKQREVKAELKAHSPVGKVKQGRISQLMKHFGGWRAAVKLIRNTLAAVTSRGYKPSTENSFYDEQWIISTYLPLIASIAITDPVEAVKELVDIALVHGWAKFKEFLAQIEHGLQQQLVELVLEIYALVDMASLEELAIDGGEGFP